MATIKIRIKKNKQVVVEVDGMKGTACHDISQCFTEGLGTITKVEEKPEIYEQIDDINQWIEIFE